MNERADWKKKLHIIIFGTRTWAGKQFDMFLLVAILLSVLLVVLESVSSIQEDYGQWMHMAEWFFTIIFSIEYVLRIMCSVDKRGYIFSYYGIIDLLAVLPTYLSMFVQGPQAFLVIRSLRLLRVFRVLKLGRFIREMDMLFTALADSKNKIIVFLAAIFTLTLILGTAMYLIEGEQAGFSSIPRSMYWAIVTMTTVGYGDIAPQTIIGQTLASIIMVLGYAIIVVPTGIFSVALASSSAARQGDIVCPHCLKSIPHKIK